MRTLKQGHKGNDVRLLQYKLGIEADGVFGAGTLKALKAYQATHKLAVDGCCGPKTQAALGMADFHVLVWDPERVQFVGTPYPATIKPLRTLREWSELVPTARYILNLAFFNSTGGTDEYGVVKGRTLTYVRGQGRDIGYGGPDEPVIHLNSANRCGGYKVGVVDGKRKAVSAIGKRSRNANGILEDGRYFHVQSVMPATESAMVSWMVKNYDVRHLLIQDGGGSVGFYDVQAGVLLAPEKEGRAGRPVATVAALF